MIVAGPATDAVVSQRAALRGESARRRPRRRAFEPSDAPATDPPELLVVHDDASAPRQGSRPWPLSRRISRTTLAAWVMDRASMTIARVLRIVLASLHLLVGIGLAVPSSSRADHHGASPTATTTGASMAGGCAEHSGGAKASHHTTKVPCAPPGKAADHRHCPNCPNGGACSDLQVGTPVLVEVLRPVRSTGRLGPSDTADPTGRNPLPDPRPPRAFV